MRTTQPIQTAPGQPYGEAGAQAAAQHAVPLQNGVGGVSPDIAANAPPPPVPGQHGSLFDDTARPDEPVTHGAASGPGAGLEALGAAPQQESPAVAALRAAYLAFPDEGLRDILESIDLG